MSFNVDFIAALVTILGGAFAVLKYFLDQQQKKMKATIDASLHQFADEHLDPIDKRVVVVETKMDSFLQQIALDLARVLHHPEESRKHVDGLIDRFVDGTINEQEVEDLKENLKIIRDWEPGFEAPFKIFEGEQVAAAILLHAMDHVSLGGGSK